MHLDKEHGYGVHKDSRFHDVTQDFCYHSILVIVLGSDTFPHIPDLG